jgi:uncharacterized membrane protein (UPF0127 family)
VSPLLKARGTCAIRNTQTGRIIASQVLTAFDSKTRRGGLLARDHLPDGYALVIAPCSAIHTFFMKFSIDVAFVTRQGRVVKVRTNIAPWRIAASLRAYAVVELPAGTIERTGTLPGHMLEVQAGDQ